MASTGHRWKFFRAGGLGKLDPYLPRVARSVELLGERAPAYQNPARAPQAPDRAAQHK